MVQQCVFPSFGDSVKSEYVAESTKGPLTLPHDVEKIQHFLATYLPPHQLKRIQLVNQVSDIQHVLYVCLKAAWSAHATALRHPGGPRKEGTEFKRIVALSLLLDAHQVGATELAEYISILI